MVNPGWVLLSSALLAAAGYNTGLWPSAWIGLGKCARVRLRTQAAYGARGERRFADSEMRGAHKKQVGCEQFLRSPRAVLVAHHCRASY